LVIGLLVTATTVVAAIGARPYAGGWNDGSRLATAESLVDAGSWTIDDSVFVQPRARAPSAPPPYPADDRLLMEHGTLDRLSIDGRFVSDKTPFANLVVAGEYWLIQKSTGLVARERPDRFAYAVTLASAGLSYVIAVGAMTLLAWRATRSSGWTAAVGVGFAFATCAPAYSRHVNGHEMLLAALAALLVALDASHADRDRVSSVRLASIGTLAGVAYGLDAAIGPLIVVLTLALVFSLARWRALVAVAAAAPWIALEHLLNFRIGHTVLPLNSVPAYLAWPGSPFDPTTMSGTYAHGSVWHFVNYTIDLAIGRRGFLLHNLPLLMLPAAAWRVVRVRRADGERRLALFALALSVAGWIVYGLGSTNYSGVALSIRWFVPLLAPAFYLLALDLRDTLDDRLPFAILTVVGIPMAVSAWIAGPWEPRVPLFWWWVAIGIGGVLAARARSSISRENAKTRT